jgi:hypothetical protein
MAENIKIKNGWQFKKTNLTVTDCEFFFIYIRCHYTRCGSYDAGSIAFAVLAGIPIGIEMVVVIVNDYAVNLL